MTTPACLDIELRQSKYLNNLVEQNHRAVKRIVNPMLGFKIVLECPEADRRHRDHAHDQEGSDELSRRINRVYSGPVLQPGRLIIELATQLLSSGLH